ncbi:hypothetical protein SKAU_G00128550 [Synaphobranchus kaupii]|uniref:Uncharacterized protein n=1 Tax=Synaphobranchus kaupii TaxID=118154 RepID=A0A9Q1J249_SYNKA|nr:hypothetical protein SKAU_G00128550 [Synaphobranchus kaupii]
MLGLPIRVILCERLTVNLARLRSRAPSSPKVTTRSLCDSGSPPPPPAGGDITARGPICASRTERQGTPNACRVPWGHGS